MTSFYWLVGWIGWFSDGQRRTVSLFLAFDLCFTLAYLVLSATLISPIAWLQCENAGPDNQTGKMSPDSLSDHEIIRLWAYQAPANCNGVRGAWAMCIILFVIFAASSFTMCVSRHKFYTHNGKRGRPQVEKARLDQKARQDQKTRQNQMMGQSQRPGY